MNEGHWTRKSTILAALVVAISLSSVTCEAGDKTTNILVGKHRSASMRWHFLSRVERAKADPKWLEKTHASYIQQLMHQGESRSQAESEAGGLIQHMADGGPDLRDGTKLAQFSGSTVREALKTHGLKEGPNPRVLLDHETNNYIDGDSKCTYFDPSTTMVSEISLASESKNPFDYCDGTPIDPIIFCMQPLCAFFTEDDLQDQSEDTVTFDKRFSSTSLEGHEVKVVYDAKNSVIKSVTLYSPYNTKMADYVVTATKSTADDVIPSEIKFALYDHDENVKKAVTYQLESAEFDSKVDTRLMANMGPDHVSVTDFRLGKNDVRTYVKNGPLPTIEELKGKATLAGRKTTPYKKELPIYDFFLVAAFALFAITGFLLLRERWVNRSAS